MFVSPFFLYPPLHLPHIFHTTQTFSFLNSATTHFQDTNQYFSPKQWQHPCCKKELQFPSYCPRPTPENIYQQHHTTMNRQKRSRNFQRSVVSIISLPSAWHDRSQMHSQCGDAEVTAFSWLRSNTFSTSSDNTVCLPDQCCPVWEALEDPS